MNDRDFKFKYKTVSQNIDDLLTKHNENWAMKPSYNIEQIDCVIIISKWRCAIHISLFSSIRRVICIGPAQVFGTTTVSSLKNFEQLIKRWRHATSVHEGRLGSVM